MTSETERLPSSWWRYSGGTGSILSQVTTSRYTPKDYCSDIGKNNLKLKTFVSDFKNTLPLTEVVLFFFISYLCLFHIQLTSSCHSQHFTIPFTSKQKKSYYFMLELEIGQGII